MMAQQNGDGSRKLKPEEVHWKGEETKKVLKTPMTRGQTVSVKRKKGNATNKEVVGRQNSRPKSTILGPMTI